MKCLHCESLYINKSLIYESKYWRITLAPDQGYLGRCYINLRRHIEKLSELKKEEWIDFAELVKIMESALKKAFCVVMFNWTCLMNNAYQDELPNPHVHWHLRPRYDHKVEFSGVIFEDKEFGKHYDRTRNLEVSDEIRNKIISRIKENL
ncbi:MAG: HIT family protein [Nanoarchaeota archaeon]